MTRMDRYTDAAQFGFAPEATGTVNAQALQQALDQGGTITVARPGVYKIARTVYIGSYTTINFGNGVFLQKVDEEGAFAHVMLNKGALTRTYDEHITIANMHIQVNHIDIRKFEVFGLHGQLAFFYVKDLRIDRFRCFDLGPMQYGIQICTFEDILLTDLIIKGDKDGVHLGRGKRFVIRDGVFETYDDAIALNAHDYDVGNPELGWIEDGLIENCHDLADDKREETVGFFCRILAGAWKAWEPGIVVQKSDSVVSQGRVYRVKADPDGHTYRSITPPTHLEGTEVLDGISWTMVQTTPVYSAGVRNVTFRHISLNKPRIGFSIHFDHDRYSRSYYPGAEVVQQQNLRFDDVRVQHDVDKALLSINTPVDVLSICNSSIKHNAIVFRSNGAMTDYLPTSVNLVGCVFGHEGEMALIRNQVVGKVISLRTSASLVSASDFQPVLEAGDGRIDAVSDLLVHPNA